MTLVVPRMIGAVAGFITKHGKWPTRLLVPIGNWTSYRKDPEPVHRSYDRPSTWAMFARLQLVPVPRELYIAMDEEGRSFDYDEEETPSDWWGVVEGSLAAESSRSAVAASHAERGSTPLTPPIENSYVVPGTMLSAGEYPGSPPSNPTSDVESKLARFVSAGVRAFIDLTSPSDGLAPYEPALRSVAGAHGTDVTYERHTIRDMDVCDPDHMIRVLDAIDARIAEGRPVYVHCWGGVGRTGMVVGCWLVRHGCDGEEALRQVSAMFRAMSADKVRRHARWGSPQTEDQRAMVRAWAKHERAAGEATAAPAPALTDANARPSGAQSASPAPARCGDGKERVSLPDALAEWGARRHVDLSTGEGGWIRFTVEWNEQAWPCTAWIDGEDRRLTIRVDPAEPLPDAHRAAMLEAVARANYGFVHGHFTYDVRDGELYFVSSTMFAEDGMAPVEVDRVIGMAVQTMANYHVAFRDVTAGIAADVAVARVEGGAGDEDDPELDAELDAILEELNREERTEAVRAAWELLTPSPDATPEIRDRMRGALVGLAVGDAVGTTVEFQARGSFPPVTDMTGGGPFSLQPGQWTDDTSLALCLAESLIEQRQFDPRDQMERYVRWWREGHLSSTGSCFDIGNTTRRALGAFERSKQPFAGPTDDSTAGNGSLMRLAPVPLFHFGAPEQAIELAGESSRTTHGAPVAIDACRYLAALIVGAVGGASKEELLAPSYAPVPRYWDSHPLHPVIGAIAAGSFKEKSPPAIRGGGYSAHALEAALWAFHNSADFEEGCLLAVNLGDDADTTAAIYGQIAGAFYGESGIPHAWRAKLAHKGTIDRYAELLFQLAFDRPPVMGARTSTVQADATRAIAEAGGDPGEAIRRQRQEEERQKQEMGLLHYYMSGPMSAQASRQEMLLQLRVALGESISA